MGSYATYKPCKNHPDRWGVRRGLCDSCYQGIIKEIRKGEISDAQAVKQGLINKQKVAGRIRRVMPFPKTP